jgi:nucleoid-associated protein YgaU
MLNKDQYNEDVYNDYYAQEVRGAEISTKESGGSNKKIVIILVLLLLISVVGYFGFKSMNSSAQIEETTTNKSNTALEGEESKDAKKSINTPIETPEESIQADRIAEQVEESISSSDNSNEKMNPEDIANIVKMVMMKMNKEKAKGSSTEPSTPPSPANLENQEKDNELIQSLSTTDVDSLSSISEDDDKKKPTLSKDVDIYNKVVLKEGKSDNSDALSQLSDEISSVIDSEDSKPTDNNNYTASITKEVETRQKEMRYYIVKKGDNLGKIAKRFYGNVMDFKKIYEANPDILRRPDKVYIGQKLRIP